MPIRGPKISLKIRTLIIRRALEEPRIPRDAVATHLVDEIERMGLISPSEETMLKIVSQARNSATNSLDKPWTIGSLNKYDVPPEIVPVLIEIQKNYEENESKHIREGLTIREAKWVARLYPLITEIYRRRVREELDALNKRPVNKTYSWLVWMIAETYALMERASQIIGEDCFNTSALDSEYFIAERFWDRLDSGEPDFINVVTRTIYEMVQKEWGDGRVKQNRTDNNIPDI